MFAPFKRIFGFTSIARLVVGMLGVIAVSTGFAQGTGGTVSNSAGYVVHTFSSSGTFTLSGTMNVEVVIVGGGGGGACQHGGGGGGGGVLVWSGSVGAGSYTVTVGGGGAGGNTSTWRGGQGGNSSVFGLTAYGGGAGSMDYGGAAAGGGSGGGFGYSNPAAGADGTAGQGYPGNRADTGSTVNGGGGGGAGGAGSGIHGGSGKTTWAGTHGGGGGGGFAGGIGGSGGGANGGNGAAAGGHAPANTGGGGGGGGNMSAFGGNGGSGIVFIRYLPNSAPSVSMTVNGYGNGGSFSASIGNQLTIALSASDSESNLRAINLWVLTPATGYWRNIRSDNSANGGFVENATTDNAVSSGGANVASLSGTRYFTIPLSDGFGTYTFVARSIDAEGAISGSHQVTVSVSNRYPIVTTSAGAGSIYLGQSITFSATASDADGNLNFHGLIFSYDGGSNWRRVPSTDHSSGWGDHGAHADGISASYTSGTVYGSSSTRSITVRPSSIPGSGYVHAHSNTHDGLVWASSESYNWNTLSVGYAQTQVLKATPSFSGWSNQSRTGTGTFPSAFTASVSNPYSGAVTAPTGGISYSVVSASGAGAFPTSGAVNGSTTFYPGTYTVRASYGGDGNYNANSSDVTFTVYNQQPTASVSVDRSSANMGDTVNVTVTYNDPDGQLYMGMLWVHTPNRGWLKITPSNGLVVGGDWDYANRTASNNGSYARSYTISLTDGFGTYSFQAGAYDVQGSTYGTSNQTVSVARRFPFVTVSTSPSTISFGQTATVTANATHADNNLLFHGILHLNEASSDWMRGSMTNHSTGWWGNHPVDSTIESANYTTGAASGGSSTRSIVIRPGWVGSHTFHTNAHDDANWASTNAANWAASTGYAYLTVNKATPTGSFANRTRTPAGSMNYTVVAGDLNATFANPYSGAVTAPGGAITYTVVSSTQIYSGAAGPSGMSVTAGTTLAANYNYVVRATIASDARYNAASVDATWTIANTAPVNQSMSTSKASYDYGEAITVYARSTDTNGDLVNHHIVVAHSSHATNNWEGNSPDGWKWQHYTTTGASGSDYTSTTSPLVNNNYGTGRNLPLGTYRLSLNSQDSLPQWTYSTGVMASFTIVKATPTGSFSGVTRTPSAGSSTYAVVAGDLAATFTNPHYSGVTAPTGAVTYTIAPSSPTGTVGSAVSAGTLLTAGSTYVIRANYPGDALYNSATADATFTINKANQAAVSITSGNSFVYGNSYTATASGGNGSGALVWSLGAGSTAPGATINGSTGAVTTSGSGTVVIRVYRAADAQFNQSATTSDFTITVTARPITVTLSGSKTYNGNTTATGASGAITSGSLAPGDTISYAYGPTSSANAGSYPASTPGLFGATISNVSAPTTRTSSYAITWAGSYVINQGTQAAVTITSGNSFVYGNSYTATATGGTGSGAIVWQLGAGSTASGATINSSTGAVTANSSGTVVIKAYRAAETNYAQSATTSDFTITVTARPITVTLSGSKTYNGNTTATGASGAITSGSLASGDSISYTYGPTSSANAGSYPAATPGLFGATISNASAPTTRTSSYAITWAGSYVIGKATPVVYWANPAAITYGTALSGTQLNARVTAPTVALSHNGQTNLNAASFTFDGTGWVVTTGASAASCRFYFDQAKLVPNQTYLITVWADNLTGSASSTYLDWCDAGVGPQVVINGGTATFTGVGSRSSYDATYRFVDLNIPANSSLRVLGANALNQSNLAGSFSYTPAAGAVLAAGTQTLNTTFTPTDTTNYNPANGSASLVVNKASQPTPTITSGATVVYGNSYTATASGGAGGGALVWSLGTGSTAPGAAINPSTGAVTTGGVGTVKIKVSRDGDANYLPSSATADFTINVTARPITVTLSGSKVFNGNTAAIGATANITSGTLAGTDTISYAFSALSGSAVGYYSGITTATISNASAPTTRTSSYAITYAGTYAVNWQLTVAANPPAGGAVTGSGVYAPGASANISATANGGYAFGGWSGTGIAAPSTGATTVTASSNITVTADFISTAGAVNYGTIIFDDVIPPGIPGYTATTSTRTATLRNNGNSNLAIPTFTETGNFAADATLPITIPPDTATDVVSTFSAPALGLSTGVLTIVTNDTPRRIVQYSLQGYGRDPRTPPVSTLTPESATVYVGSPVLVSLFSSDVGGGMTSQSIDYMAPGSGTWVTGTAGAGSAWSGAATRKRTLAFSIPGTSNLTTGVWQFRGTAAYVTTSVTVVAGPAKANLSNYSVGATDLREFMHPKVNPNVAATTGMDVAGTDLTLWFDNIENSGRPSQAKILGPIHTFSTLNGAAYKSAAGPLSTSALEFGSTTANAGLDFNSHGVQFYNGQSYVFGFWARTLSGSRTIDVAISDDDNTGVTSSSFTIGTDWTWVWVAKTFSSLGANPRLFYCYSASGGAFQVANPTVVRGTPTGFLSPDGRDLVFVFAPFGAVNPE